LRFPNPIILLLSLIAAPLVAAAEPRPDPQLDRCDADVSQRLLFLEDRLAMHERYANRWWRTWNGVFLAGIAVQGTRAGFEDGTGQRADYIVGAVKSGIGLTVNWLRQPAVRNALDTVDAIPTTTPADCLRRLGVAEDIVRRAAEQAHDERKGLRPHLANLALNLAGALIVAEGFDEGTGWASGLIGFTIGEVRIWTYPWQSAGTLDEYGRRFPGPVTGGPPGWRLEPFHTGARVTFVW
jgi:hypothetical protein